MCCVQFMQFVEQSTTQKTTGTKSTLHQNCRAILASENFLKVCEYVKLQLCTILIDVLF